MIELSQTFYLYQQQYLSKSQTLQDSPMDPLTLTDKPQYDRISKLIQECLTLQKQIDLELCSLPLQQKELLQTKYKPLKKMIFKKKQQFSEVVEPGEREGEGEREESEQTDNLISQNDKLMESKKLLYQMGDMSDNIVGELRVQTGKLQRQGKKLEQTRELLETGSRILDRIWVQKKKYKIIMYCLCIAVGVIFTYHLL